MGLHDFCGLDFGTSNSTIGIYDGKQIKMVPLEAGNPSLRSAIFFEDETHRCLFGQQGITEYLSGGQGRLLMSLKSILGSSLMAEKTQIGKRWIPYADILEHLLQHIKKQAEAFKEQTLSQVVLGRPVRFHDTDDKRDRLAQDTLEKVAHQVGFKTVHFQFEPIAAALSFEQTLKKEQLAFIVDLGGGTSDFTVIRLRPNPPKKDRQEDVLGNQGIHIGGTDFDTLFSLELVMPHLGLGGRMKGISNTIEIPSGYYHDLTTWHTINSLYTHQTKQAVQSIVHHALDQKPVYRLLRVIEKQQGHKILNEVEQAKCQLSAHEEAILDFNFIEDNFIIKTHKQPFEEIIANKTEDLLQTIKATLLSAGLKPDAIDSLFFTGGTSQIPYIYRKIKDCFPNANVVAGDVFSSVGKGLILDAKQRFL